MLVAIPVILGALARIPMGMLADRFGGRAVFTALLAFCAVPIFLVPAATTYRQILALAFLARTGRVLHGPPRRPLPRIVLERRGDVLLAKGIDLQRVL